MNENNSQTNQKQTAKKQLNNQNQKQIEKMKEVISTEAAQNSEIIKENKKTQN